ncbi:hypothetical protein LY76DRAFT_324832 [Colletotrichum caudatum]|nr:hypothetical protein LY76DRAFT_324832 [Colletotrichum caudatum]
MREFGMAALAGVPMATISPLSFALIYCDDLNPESISPNQPQHELCQTLVTSRICLPHCEALQGSNLKAPRFLIHVLNESDDDHHAGRSRVA